MLEGEKQVLHDFQKNAAADAFHAQRMLDSAIVNKNRLVYRTIRRKAAQDQVRLATSQLLEAQDTSWLLSEIENLNFHPNHLEPGNFSIDGTINGTQVSILRWGMNLPGLEDRNRYSANLNGVELTENAAQTLANRYYPMLSIIRYNTRTIAHAKRILGIRE